MQPLQGKIGNTISLKGKTYDYFAGNDYLGLASHPETIKAATVALQKYGVSFAASRQTTGTSDLHLELERLLAEFKGEEAAMVFASGYMGNRLLLETLKERYSLILADSMAHPSILDGIPRGFTDIRFYNHCDPNHLEKLLKESKNNNPQIITDGIFALTGEIAPLDQIYNLAGTHNANVIIDDAHATGVIGANGRGTPEYFNISKASNFFQSETMSKALGSYGGFLTGSHNFISELRNQSAFYGASTALPPAVVATSCASLKILKENPLLRIKVLENAEFLRKGIQEAGFSSSGDITPIIPLYFNKKESAQHLSAWLEDHLIIAPAVSYPVKTDQFIVRITVSATHTSAQIENLVSLLKKWHSNRNTPK